MRSCSASVPRWSTRHSSPRSETSRILAGASAVGIYRLWRDGGFAVGAILAGIIADTLGIATAIWSVAALTALSGLVVAIRMYETHPKERKKGPDDSIQPDQPRRR